MSATRQLAKTLFEFGYLHSWGRVASFRRRQDALVLAFHNVRDDDAPLVGDSSLHLSGQTFRAFVDALRDVGHVVPLADLETEGSGKRPRIALTFDDAYRGAIRNALPYLVQHGLAATVFVAPAFVGGKQFWWDSLAGSGGLPPTVRDHGLGTLSGADPLIREWAAAVGRPDSPLPDCYSAATLEELKVADGLPGITWGIHTWGHRRLDSLTEPEIRKELEDCWAWLQEHLVNTIPWVTYPYGMFDERVVRITEELGFTGGLKVDGGWMTSSTHPMRRPRTNIPAGLSVMGFRLRLAGLTN